MLIYVIHVYQVAVPGPALEFRWASLGDVRVRQLRFAFAQNHSSSFPARRRAGSQGFTFGRRVDTPLGILMKKLLAAVSLGFAFTSPALLAQASLKIPANKPVASNTFPEGW